LEWGGWQSEPRERTNKLSSRLLIALYSSKIIKAGAFLADTKTLLARWNVADSVQANMERIRSFGRAE